MKFIYALLAALLVSAFACPAFAFAPDDEELAASLRKNYGPMTSWEAHMEFPRYPGVSVDIWYARGKWRQEWHAGDQARAVGMGGNVAAACTAGNFALSPMFVWMVPNPVATWNSWGIESSRRNFGFCGDHPCFMIGANPGQDDAPAIWLNNEDYAPLLVRYMSDVGLTTVEFVEYKTFAGYRVPQKVIVTVGDESLECLVSWKRVNGADSEELYARDALDTTPCAEPSAPFQFLRDIFHYPQAK